MPVALLDLVNHTSTQAAGAGLGNSTGSAADADLGIGVVCAWPVSGQYGPGSRVLYYVLVATCVFARKAEWLRNACLAAALLFPAVAALHGLVLAALHVNGAVDMDVYGAFQLCSIGILAAPLTVRLSRTYFYDPGRNTIFLWTGLILAGLLALTVEFYRATAIHCPYDDEGNPIHANPNEFPYGNAKCGLVCSVEEGPHSPMRGGSANNIYIIPAPNKLSFNTAMLLAAACCIPAILSMIFMCFKILDIIYKTQNQDGEVDAPIEGTNGATTAKMRGVEGMVRLFLSVIEIPLFSAAVLAILAIGEINFFSSAVRYQTEPMASIGQWAPVAGTFLAALGSLYLLMTAKPLTPEPEGTPPYPPHPSSSGQMSERNPTPHPQPSIELPRSSRSTHDDIARRSSHDLHHAPTVNSRPPQSLNDRQDRLSNDLYTMPTITTRPSQIHDSHPRSTTVDAGRRTMAKFFTKTGNYLGTAAHDKFDISHFKEGPAVGFPEIPGERGRNPNMSKVERDWSERVSRDPNRMTRVGSSANSFISANGVEGSPTTAVRDGSPRAVEPFGSPRTESPGGRTRARRDTLEVPVMDR